MFPLKNLPNEVILRIIDAVHPGDIEAFAACGDEDIAILAARALRRHSLLKAEYSALVFDTYAEYGSREATFLDEVSENIYVAHYPTELHFRPHEERRCEHQRLSPSTIQKLAELLGQASFLQTVCPWEDEEDLQRGITKQPSGKLLIINLLIEMLPNIQKLFIPKTFSLNRFTISASMNRCIYKTGCNGNHLHENRPFSQLKAVTLDCRGDEFLQENTTFRLLAWFASLSSIRSLSGRIIRGADFNSEGNPVEWAQIFSHRVSTITELCLENSAIHVKAFNAFLVGVTALRKFKYHHGLRGVPYNPRQIIECLTRHARSSLELLDLSADQRLFFHPEQGGQSIGSMIGFTELKVIRVDDKLFETPMPVESSDPKASDGPSSRPEQQGDHRFAMGRLVDALPKSTETLTLMLYRDGTWFFRDLVELKGERLPRLQSIIVENANPFDPEMQQALGGVGISTTSLYEEPEDIRYSSSSDNESGNETE
ncbi:MAG: hypothetical protein Q9170_002179 [Blastenia crenularia]